MPADAYPVNAAAAEIVRGNQYAADDKHVKASKSDKHSIGYFLALILGLVLTIIICTCAAGLHHLHSVPMSPTFISYVPPSRANDLREGFGIGLLFVCECAILELLTLGTVVGLLEHSCPWDHLHLRR